MFKDNEQQPEGFSVPLSEALDAYRRATFCLQPWGDTATRKGYWDAKPGMLEE